MPKTEIIQRFNILNDKMAAKFADRPTLEIFNKNKKETFQKIGNLENNINKATETLDKLNDHQENYSETIDLFK